MSQSQIVQLKALQDELVACMQHQSKEPHDPDAPLKDPRICYRDGEYWKGKFEALFSEHRGLKELLEHSQRNVVLHDPRLEERCAGDVPDDFHKLKLDLILNQMQHLQLMKTFNEVRHQERRSREKARQLEEENEELRARLVEEETDDVLLQQQLEDKVQKLKEENEKLKSRLGQDSLREATLLSLARQVQELQTENQHLKQTMQETPLIKVEEEKHTSRVSLLRDKVNHLVMENEDLRGVVARLRYGPPLQTTAPEDVTPEQTTEKDCLEKQRTPSPGTRDNTATLDMGIKEKLDSLSESLKRQQSDSKHWRKLYEELKGSREKEGATSVWKKLLGLAQTLYDDMESALDSILESLFRLVKESSHSSTEVAVQLQDLVEQMRKEVTHRRSELKDYLEQPVEEAALGQGMAISRTMSLLEGSVRKVFEAGVKFISKSKEATDQKVDKLLSKLSKVAQALKKKLERSTEENMPKQETMVKEDKKEIPQVTRKPKQERITKEDTPEVVRKRGEVGGLGKQISNYEEDEEEMRDWYSSRAKGRENQRGGSGVDGENWYLRRRNWRLSGGMSSSTRAPSKQKPQSEKKSRRNSSHNYRSFSDEEM